jgi:PIN domain nuclease of toxin-antitoxin system
MAVVLDTHVWLWWASDRSRLSARAATAIEGAETVAVPAICCWEVAMLVARGRIVLDRPAREWVRAALGLPGVRALPLDPPTAVAAAEIDDDGPSDPADRMIYAAARAIGAPLVTKDKHLREFDPRGTLW